MDRMVSVVVNGIERHLNYSIEVMFEMAEKYGSISAALDIISGEDSKAFETVRWFFVKMANDGELCRREVGYDPAPLLKESDVSLRMSPIDFALLKEAVVNAIENGYRRETDDGESQEIDLGLEELRAKKARAGE